VRRCLFGLFVALCLLPGCGGTTRYTNSAHPNYTEAEYKSDLAQCRKENSKIVMMTGYEDHAETQVDEAKAQACMGARGWKAASQ
jgi:hypothetical protein